MSALVEVEEHPQPDAEKKSATELKADKAHQRKAVAKAKGAFVC